MRLSAIHAGGLYHNGGEISIVVGDTRIALVDLQSKAKRGEAYKAKCSVRDANAARILTCWNAHDALVAACNKVVNNWGDLHPKDLQQLRAALRLATGGQP